MRPASTTTRRQQRLPLVAMLLCLSLSPASHGEERPLIHFAYPEFPPFSYTDSQGQAAGELIERIRQLLQQAGYPADFRSLPSARLYNALVDGSVQLSAGAPGVPQLQNHILESRHTLTSVDLNLYYRSDTEKPQLPADLQGKRLILISGYTYRPPISDWLADPTLELHLSHTRTHQAALAMLLLKRGDYLIDYSSPIEQELRAEVMPALPYINLRHLPIKLIVSLAMPGAEQLRDDLDRAYEALYPNLPADAQQTP